MVRLKERGKKTATGLCLFQFHYGTIKSANPEAFMVRMVIFQFHYGTIKSVTGTVHK